MTDILLRRSPRADLSGRAHDHALSRIVHLPQVKSPTPLFPRCGDRISPICQKSILVFSFPFGIATAASVRVGNLLGAQKPRRARVAAHVCLVLGVGIMSLFSMLIYAARFEIGAIFTKDPAVIRLVAKIAPICALFQIADGFQVFDSPALLLPPPLALNPHCEHQP